MSVSTVPASLLTKNNTLDYATLSTLHPIDKVTYNMHPTYRTLRGWLNSKTDAWFDEHLGVLEDGDYVELMRFAAATDAGETGETGGAVLGTADGKDAADGVRPELTKYTTGLFARETPSTNVAAPPHHYLFYTPTATSSASPSTSSSTNTSTSSGANATNESTTTTTTAPTVRRIVFRGELLNLLVALVTQCTFEDSVQRLRGFANVPRAFVVDWFGYAREAGVYPPEVRALAVRKGEILMKDKSVMKKSEMKNGVGKGGEKKGSIGRKGGKKVFIVRKA